MIITLLTDFGTADYFTGAMKGAILSLDPEAVIVDITHEIPPQDVQAAGFALFACYKDFPRRTIYVAVVDPGVGSDRRAILAVTDDYYFISPDNGLLSLILQAEPGAKIFHLNKERFFRHPVSNTFHGRDIFAPVAGWLSKGVLPEELGDEITDPVLFKTSKPERLNENKIRGEILHIDHFGNCVTNLDEQLLPDGFHLEIKGRRITRKQKFYAEADSDEKVFMIYGSAGFLEVCAFRDSAARILEVSAGDEVLVRLNQEISG
jgi:S-adenosylmethionine hydrolase